MNFLLYYLNKSLRLDPKTLYSIGRDPHNSIQLQAPNVSRHHSMLYWKNQGFTIEDLKSTNGTWVNGDKISNQQLEDGDKIQIGSHYLEYKVLSESTESRYQKSDTLVIEEKIEDILDEVSNAQIKKQVMELKEYITKKKEELKDLAFKDKLTNLYNRRFFDERMAEEWERAHRYKRDLALIMIDIDHFKQINDQYGHQEGDRALKTVANLIFQSIRKNDIASRYGGEEMVVILPETRDITALKAAEKIRLNIELKAKAVLGFSLTISAGVAGKGETTTKSNDLIELADQALYYSKKNGRNRVSLYNQAYKGDNYG